MTLHDVRRIYAHWSKYPPVRDLVAAAIGFKPKTEADSDPKKYVTADDLRRLMKQTGGKMPGMAAMGQ